MRVLIVAFSCFQFSVELMLVENIFVEISLFIILYIIYALVQEHLGNGGTADILELQRYVGNYYTVQTHSWLFYFALSLNLV